MPNGQQQKESNKVSFPNPVSFFKSSRRNLVKGLTRTKRRVLAFSGLFILANYLNPLNDSLTEKSGTLLTRQTSQVHKIWPGESELTISHVAFHRNRYDHPWLLPKRIEFPTITESRNRILYSPVREAAGDGIGHAFGTMNAEVGVALRLGLSYTHRNAQYGSLTTVNRNAVESFFGWGVETRDRAWVRENFCISNYIGHRMHCQTCNNLKKNSTMGLAWFQQLVEVPLSLSYRRQTCSIADGELFESIACKNPIQKFLLKHNKANTIFQMPVRMCDKAPVDGFVDSASRSYFFHKYWDLHGGLYHKSSRSFPDPVRAKMHIENQHNEVTRRPPVRFKEDALVFAIHARRGDFFDVKRPMTSIRTFAIVIQQVMQIIHDQRGIFSRLPVSVHVYSEGRSKDNTVSTGHNITQMTKEFYDSDGIKRNGSWIADLIRNQKQAKKSRSSEPDLFRNGLAVYLHIATDTIQALHEMVSADVFIGSSSAMSKFLVSSLSRGAFQLIPRKESVFQSRCCFTRFIERVGIIEDRERLKNIWAAYEKANEDTARRAYYLNRAFA